MAMNFKWMIIILGLGFTCVAPAQDSNECAEAKRALGLNRIAWTGARTGWDRCFRGTTFQIQNGFSTDYISQNESTVEEARLLLTETEAARTAIAVLHERPPDQVGHPAFRGIIRNASSVSAAPGVPHGRGTLGLMSSHSQESVRKVFNDEVYLTESASPRDLKRLLEEMVQQNRTPGVVNASHGALGRSSSPEQAREIGEVLEYACNHGILISQAAGNGGPVDIPEKYKDCVMSATSLDASLQKSTRSTTGNHVDVAVVSDRYQRSVDMYHGWTSGAAPVLSSALMLFKKVVPNRLTAQQAKALLAASSDQIDPPGGLHNDQIGYGKLNAPKLILLGQMFKNGKLPARFDLSAASIAELRRRLQSEIINSADLKQKTFATRQQAQQAMNRIPTCTQTSACCKRFANWFQKLRLTYLLRKDSPGGEEFREELQDLYKSVGAYHQAALLSPRNRQGRLVVDRDILNALLNVNPSSLPYEDYLKYADLMRGIELDGASLDRLKTSFTSQLQSFRLVNKNERDITQSVPKERAALELFRSQLGSAYQSYVNSIAERNEDFKRLIEEKSKGK